MHFLCLHGAGTNSQIFETQTAALRYELGNQHTFEFVEAVYPTTMAPELEGVASPDDSFFSWWDDQNIEESSKKCLEQLEAYILSEGPFDGILAFSQGATVAASFLAHMVKSSWNHENDHSLLKCAIFMSSNGAYDISGLTHGAGIRLLTLDHDGEIIKIPTAHIWGSHDTTVNSISTMKACSLATREFYIHGGTHEVPGTRIKDDLRSCVRIIRRVIAVASYNHSL